ncbi:MAG: lysophospholipid acyltransferase family protein [Candidatus Lambdaproteobacteria bacterium]|nr:lysophospholipid acyltransferase family protein [Candidatus Lambdaproteobacteria bacterium]
MARPTVAPDSAGLDPEGPDYSGPDYTGMVRRRSKRWQPLRHALEYGLARAMLALTALIPVPLAQRCGRWTGALGYRLARDHRAVMRYQLAMALPERCAGAGGAAERERIVRACFGHLGMTLWEALALPRIRREAGRWVLLENAQALRAAHGRGRGVIVLTGHMGNWELLSAVFERLRIPAQAMVRTMVNRRIHALMQRRRTSAFLGLIERGSPASPRQMLSSLKRGEALIFAIDQDIEGQGVFVDFFGIPAHTPRVAAALALKHDVPVVTAFGVRRPDGTHLFRFEPLSLPPRAGNDADATLACTQVFSRAIEAAVRTHPEQWAWHHRRWKRRPPGGAKPHG